jgi:hypothetical protein
LPIVAVTISRRIEGCFGGAAVRIVSAVMLGLPDVTVSAQPVRFIGRPRGTSRHSRDFRVIAGQLRQLDQ